MSTIDLSEWVYCREAARMLGCSSVSVWKLVRAGRVRSFRPEGGLTRIPVADIQRLIAAGMRPRRDAAEGPAGD
jgi:excisionase family DNA binding protein